MNEMRRGRLAPALVVLVALTAAGCSGGSGGSSKGSSATTSTSTNGATSIISPATTAANLDEPVDQPPIKLIAPDAGQALTAKAVADGTAQMAYIRTVVAAIDQLGLVRLEDDRNLQPSQRLGFFAGTAALAATPGLQAALDELNAALQTPAAFKVLQDELAKDPTNRTGAARVWLTSLGLLKATPALAGTVKIGSNDTPSVWSLTEAVAVYLEARGMKVVRSLGSAPRETFFPTFVAHDVDITTDIRGSLLASLGGQTSDDPAVQQANLEKILSGKGVTVFKPTALDNPYVMVVTKATAEKYKLTKVSDVASIPGQLTMAAEPACPKRPLCMVGLNLIYGLVFAVPGQ